MKNTAALYKGPDNPSDRPFKVGAKNMTETMALLVESAASNKASAASRGLLHERLSSLANFDVVASLIRIDGVAKTYQTADGPVESLKPLTFEIGDGEFMAIVGPSGVQVELLKMVADCFSLVRRDRADGSESKGRPITSASCSKPVLLAWRTVLDNVLLQIDMRRLPRSRYIGKAARAARHDRAR